MPDRYGIGQMPYRKPESATRKKRKKAKIRLTTDVRQRVGERRRRDPR